MERNDRVADEQNGLSSLEEIQERPKGQVPDETERNVLKLEAHVLIVTPMVEEGV